MKIAVAGKGGVGKTTISAALSRYFAGLGYDIYAVDADPDMSLGTVLGIPDGELEDLKPIIDMRETIRSQTGGGGVLYSLNPDVNALLEDYHINFEGIRFFKMGAVKQGGTSCYCRENSVLHALVSALLLDKKEMVLLDMGAGIEHLTRGTARGVDMMLIVTEPTKVSLETAKTIRKLAADLGIRRTGIVVNKIGDEGERELVRGTFPERDIVAEIFFDASVRRGEVKGDFESEIKRIGSELLAEDTSSAADGMEG